MKRKQLTLFLNELDSKSIESIRRRFNPIQFELIKSHITLCREDEIENLSHIQRNLENLEMQKFEMQTNGLKRFSDEKGVLISVIDKKQQFQELRELVLRNENSNPRKHNAHITLMHPRNSTCDDMKFKEIQKSELPKKLRISKISLIEQEIGKEWKILKEYELKNKNES